MIYVYDFKCTVLIYIAEELHRFQNTKSYNFKLHYTLARITQGIKL